ncbi:chitinase-3-like protein 1 [Aplysia californica]|uniref:Chitinase-3-like protein 1 n=1 Tax=Aplysia californica TaxID=6500 RepID=A0ABM1AD00_APLCA|nr:chitinase-3-like protein 1 [Aplysia californica]
MANLLLLSATSVSAGAKRGHCAYYGVCDDDGQTTSAIDNPPTNPTQPPANNPTPTTTSCGGPCQRRVCYYTSWAQYRQGDRNKFFPEDIDPSLCSHVMYSFAKMVGNNLAAFEWNDESTDWSTGHYEKVTNLKNQNPELKVLLAVGGWNMGSDEFTAMVATPGNRAEFVTSSIRFLREHNFDGLDLDWEYPANRGSPPGDKEKFATLVKELRAAFEAEVSGTGQPRLLLTAAVAAGQATIDSAYDIPSISAHLDFINLMTYDLHGSWERQTGHNSPLYAGQHDTAANRNLTVDWAARYWHEQGCPKHKLVIGMPLYGRSFTLTTGNTGVGAPASPGAKGPYTGEAGYASYYEACQMINNGADVYFLEDQRVPYLVYGDQWLGYDNPKSLREKVRYVRDNGYGGAMVWALDLDDFNNAYCGAGKYPLLTAINDECSR